MALLSISKQALPSVTFLATVGLFSVRALWHEENSILLCRVTGADKRTEFMHEDKIQDGAKYELLIGESVQSSQYMRVQTVFFFIGNKSPFDDKENIKVFTSYQIWTNLIGWLFTAPAKYQDGFWQQFFLLSNQ